MSSCFLSFGGSHVSMDGYVSTKKKTKTTNTSSFFLFGTLVPFAGVGVRGTVVVGSGIAYGGFP